MINFNDYLNENKTQHNLKWPYIPDHPYRILIIGGSGSGKTNTLLNLINNQPAIYKIYLYAKDPCEAKYQILSNKRESTDIDEHVTDKEQKILIIFDDMVADMINNKKLNSIVTELFIRGRKLNISYVFIKQSYFKVPKDVRLNSTPFFVMKIPNKRELQKIALDHSSDINCKDFIKIFKKSTSEPHSFLVNDATLASDNPLRFRENV